MAYIGGFGYPKPGRSVLPVFGGATFTLAKGLSVYTGNTIADADSFRAWLGRPVTYSMAFFNQQSQADLVASVDFITTRHAGRTNIWSVPMHGYDGSLANAAAGNYDAIYLDIAQKILAAAPAGAIAIRIGWEFNLSTQPWFAGDGKQATYIAVFQRIVGIFRGVSNRFRFDWCPNVQAQQMADPTAAYPGDAYVDVIGMDCYWTNGVDTSAGSGLSFFNFIRDTAYGLQWQVDFAAAHGKPAALTEWAANGDAVPAYVSGIATWVRANNYLYHSWWNGDHGGASCRIDNGDRPALAAAYRSFFAVPTITSAATYSAAQNVDYIVPLTSDQDTTIGVTWSMVSGSASVSGANLTVTGAAGGTDRTVVVRATNADGFSSTLSLTVSFVAPYSFTNAEASSYVSRMSVAPSEGRKATIDQLFTALKAGATSGTNIFAKLDTLYLFASHDAQAGLLNARSSTLFPSATNVNGCVFTTDRGFMPMYDATLPRYINTGQSGTASTDLYSQNSASFGAWSLTNLASNSGIVGNNSAITLCPRSTGDQITGFVNDFTSTPVTSTDSRGLTAANRSGSAARQFYKNGAQVGTATTASATPGANNIIFGGSGPSFPEARQLAFGFTGGSLTAAEHLDLYNAVRAYLQALGAV